MYIPLTYDIKKVGKCILQMGHVHRKARERSRRAIFPRLGRVEIRQEPRYLYQVRQFTCQCEPLFEFLPMCFASFTHVSPRLREPSRFFQIDFSPNSPFTFWLIGNKTYNFTGVPVVISHMVGLCSAGKRKILLFTSARIGVIYLRYGRK